MTLINLGSVTEECGWLRVLADTAKIQPTNFVSYFTQIYSILPGAT